MKKLHVGLVTYSMIGGGVESFLLRLGNYLTRQDFDVELVTTVEPGAWFDKVSEHGFQSRHISGYGKERRLQTIFHSLRVGRWLSKRNYDVIFLNHSVYAQAALGMLSDHTLVFPVFHNDNEWIYKTGCSNSRLWHAAVAVSPRIEQEIQQRLPDRPVVLIPHGVDIPASNFQKQPPTSADPLKVAFVGRLFQHQKNIFALPSIVEKCNQRNVSIHLTIAGEGPDEAQLKKMFDDRGISKNITFTGMLPVEKVYALLIDSHIGLMPSFYEGFGIVMQEMMACGCVFVVSHLPGVTDYAITHGANGFLVEVGNIDGFVDAIELLSQQPDVWQRMSDAARRSAVERFSIDAMGKAYVALIEAGLRGEYSLPVSRRRQLPIDLRMVNWRGVLPFLMVY